LIEELIVRVLVTDGEVEIRYAIPISPAGEATRFCHLRSDHRGHVPPGQGRRPSHAARIVDHQHHIHPIGQAEPHAPRLRVD
jgi:site-specific DNA recombinase